MRNRRPGRPGTPGGVKFVAPRTRTEGVAEAITKALGYRTAVGTVRFEVALGANGQYTFALTDNQAPAKNATEIRVRQADVFLPISIGFFIKKIANAAAVPTDGEQAIGQVHTFPDQYVFTKAGEAANLEALYNSFLQFNLGNQTVIQAMDLLQFRRVGTAQAGLQASQQTAAVGTNGSYSRSSWEGADAGFAPMLQKMIFNGQANQNIVLQLPAAVDLTPAAGNTNYAVIMMRGVQVFNSSDKIKDLSALSFLI